MKRHEIKETHEKAVLSRFIRYCSNNGDMVKIIDRPDPPDAVIMLNGSKTWIEITDAFFSKELAESITTNVSEDKKHKPVPKEKRCIIAPDEQFSAILEKVILKKYDKKSIVNVYNQNGSGILLVGVINPFDSAKNTAEQNKQKILKAVQNKSNIFHAIYLYDCHNEDTFYQIL